MFLVRFLIILLLMALGLYSCSHSERIEPIASEFCDTSHISYSLHIQPLFKGYCYSCHGTDTASVTGMMDLETFSVLKAYLDNYYQNDSIYGSLLSHIIHQKGSVPDMPPTGKMRDCEIRQVDHWLEVGAPEN